MRNRVVALTIVVLGAALVTAGPRLAGRHVAGPPDGSLTRSDLDRTPATSAYDAIQMARRDWLGSDSMTGAANVYLEMRCSDPNCLRWLEVDQVEAVHLLRAPAGGQGWPASDSERAIVVTVRPRSSSAAADTGTAESTKPHGLRDR